MEKIFCECNFGQNCEGAWDCARVAEISTELLHFYDANYDGAINLEDVIDIDHYGILLDTCDYNDDGTIDSCELHSCVVDSENKWRADFCGSMGNLYCDCPFFVPECDDSWNCEDVYAITSSVINSLDANYDGVIDL